MAQDYRPGAPVNMPREMNGLAIGAFVIAVIGLCSPLAILALILGYVAKSQIKSRNNSGAGLANAAIILGWISVVVFIVLGIALAVGGWEAWMDRMEEYKDDYNR